MNPFVETYHNTLYHYNPSIVVTRWRIPEHNIIVGGSLIDALDFRRLADQYGITHVINVETEHSDIGKLPAELLLEARFADDGSAISGDVLDAILIFTTQNGVNASYYIHCQMGGSRSPAIAYAVLRMRGVAQEAALALVNIGFAARGRNETYGQHAAHRAYLESVEQWLKNRNLAE